MSHKARVEKHAEWLADVFVPFAASLECRPPLNTLVDFDAVMAALTTALREDVASAPLWVALHIECEWLRCVAQRDLSIWNEGETLVDMVTSCLRIGKLCDGKVSPEDILSRAQHLVDMLRVTRFDHSDSVLDVDCAIA